MRTPSAILVVAALALGACGGGTDPDPIPPNGVISLNVGESRSLTASQAASIEVSGGSAGAEFVLIPFNGSQSSENTVTLLFTGTQISAASGPPNPGLVPAGGARLSATPSGDASLAALRGAARFHADLRRMEQGELGRKLAARRSPRRASGQRRRYPTWVIRYRSTRTRTTRAQTRSCARDGSPRSRSTP